jgi:hypothetical protein
MKAARVMTPEEWQLRWRFSLVAEHMNELSCRYHTLLRETRSTASLRSVAEWLNQAQPLLMKHGSEPAVDRLLGEAARYLRNAECNILAEKRKRADPEIFQELRSRIMAVIDTPVSIPENCGFPFLGKTKQIEAAIEALEDSDFAEARRWVEEAERALPEAIRAREESFREVLSGSEDA